MIFILSVLRSVSRHPACVAALGQSDAQFCLLSPAVQCVVALVEVLSLLHLLFSAQEGHCRAGDQAHDKTTNIKPMAPEHITHMHTHHTDTHMYKEGTEQMYRAAGLLNDGSKPRGEGASSWKGCVMLDLGNANGHPGCQAAVLTN